MVYFLFVVVCSTFADTFINAVAHVFYMPNCPACGEWFSLKFAMLGHLRLSNDDCHVVYRGKKTSRKRKREPSANLSKQNYDVLLERISSLEAKVDAQNKPQQQPAIKTETPVTSANQSRPSDNALLERISRVEAKYDMLNKPEQQKVTKTDTPVASANQSRSTFEDLMEYILKWNAKDNAQNKPQQQPAIKTEIPMESADISRQNNSVLLDAVHRLDAKVDILNKLEQQRSIKTDTPVLPQPKKMTWWEYTNTDRTLKNQSIYAPADEYLNRLAEKGYSTEFVRQRALEKHCTSSFHENEE
ncbi:Uncharacterised protein [uncultured archaeon]|nr:Uncharacterised protein [uncultured archaeon]